MEILTASDLPLQTPVAAAIGFFDGIHKGHSVLLRQLAAQPEKTLVYTFDRKPNVPKPLFSPSERASIMDCAGIDYYYAAPFDAQFKEQSARTFLQQLMRDFNIKKIVVGSDFRFGSDAAGDAELLQELAPKYGYTLEVVKTRGAGDAKYSSSTLRSLISEGRIPEANELMGRRYFIDGVVEPGSQRGTKIGFPTANIRADKLLPANGVYATLTRTAHGVFPSVTNVGERPTIDDGRSLTVETYLLDQSQDLYGQPIRVFFVEMLRPEVKFKDMDHLRVQIAADAERARELLSGPDVYTQYEMC